MTHKGGRWVKNDPCLGLPLVHGGKTSPCLGRLFLPRTVPLRDAWFHVPARDTLGLGAQGLPVLPRKLRRPAGSQIFGRRPEGISWCLRNNLNGPVAEYQTHELRARRPWQGHPCLYPSKDCRPGHSRRQIIPHAQLHGRNPLGDRSRLLQESGIAGITRRHPRRHLNVRAAIVLAHQTGFGPGSVGKL